MNAVSMGQTIDIHSQLILLRGSNVREQRSLCVCVRVCSSVCVTCSIPPRGLSLTPDAGDSECTVFDPWPCSCTSAIFRNKCFSYTAPPDVHVSERTEGFDHGHQGMLTMWCHIYDKEGVTSLRSSPSHPGSPCQCRLCMLCWPHSGAQQAWGSG